MVILDERVKKSKVTSRFMSWIFWVLPLTSTRRSGELFEKLTTHRILNTYFLFPFFRAALLQFPESRTPPQSPESAAQSPGT